LLTPSSGAITGASSRGDQPHPPGRAPCRPPCPPCAGALRGGVTASPVGAARRRRGPPPLQWRRRHPFPRPTPSLPWQRGCTCPRAHSWPESRPARPMSMRRRARHRPEGQVLYARALNRGPNREPGVGQTTRGVSKQACLKWRCRSSSKRRAIPRDDREMH